MSHKVHSGTQFDSWFGENEAAWHFTILTYDYIYDHGSYLRRRFFLQARQRLVVVYLFMFYSMHDANNWICLRSWRAFSSSDGFF